MTRSTVTHIEEKPGSPADVLAHHGVKGQKWGVRKEEELANLNQRSKEYIKALKPTPKLSTKETKQNLEANQSKFIDKFQSPDHTLTPKQKKILIEAGVGVGVLALAGGSYYAYRKFGGKEVPSLPHELAGKPVDFETFSDLSNKSLRETWGNGSRYIKPSSFARPAFELPQGHTFYRMSYDAEKNFDNVTYATHTIADRDRYILGNTHTGHLLTFEAKEPIKIPALSDVLDSLKAVKERDIGAKIGDDEVMKSYEHLSGGNWKDPTSKALIEHLKSKGFGGVVDEMDAGVYGDSPVVLFGDKFTSKVDHAVTESIRSSAENDLTELLSRKL